MQGRYLLYIDILGFSALVVEKSSDEIFKIVDSALAPFHRWERLNGKFKTIYFSDTFLFYQELNGYDNKAFLDAYAIGAMLLSALLAKGIPARGTITFGEFEVKPDSTDRHQLYFGKALIEAYQSEKKENWIGITIQPSAWQPYEQNNPGVITAFQNEGVWRMRDDGVLLLNPFVKLRAWYEADLLGEITFPYLQWDEPEFPNDLLGFKFIHTEAKRYEENGDFTGRVAGKYFSTVAFLQNVLGAERYEWASNLATSIENV